MRILAFSPHADDVEIGMGGTISKYTTEGHVVQIVTAIIPCEHLDGSADEDFKKKRFSEQEVSANILGAELEILDLSPYDFDIGRKNCKRFDDIIRKFRPDRIFSCWKHDSHQDHKVMGTIIEAASRKNNSSLCMYAPTVPGGITSESFRPQYYIDISNHVDKKMESISNYKSVFKNKPEYCEAILGLSRFRGQQIGVKYAEAFQVVKQIEY